MAKILRALYVYIAFGCVGPAALAANCGLFLEADFKGVETLQYDFEDGGYDFFPGWPDPEDQGQEIRVGRGKLQGRDVYFKKLAVKTPNELDFLKILNRRKIGPKVLGLVKRNEETWMVLEELNGSLYRPKFELAFDVKEGIVRPSKYHLNPDPPYDVTITPQMRRDILRTFKVLNELGIAAHDPQFILTRSGRAVLIDPEMFRYEKDAAKFNDFVRNLILEGLKPKRTFWIPGRQVY